MAPSIVGLEELCCGCGACAAGCPVSCIKMSADECGFLKPQVSGACIECATCDAICPAIGKRTGDTAVSVYWAKAIDGILLRASSSGGLFGLLAANALERCGVFYGAVFSEGLKCIRHNRVDNTEGLDAVQRSKYVQSTIGKEIYEQVRDDLMRGIFVLYAGTGCQVAGLKGYLENIHVNQTGLFCVDIICHGVPTPKLWAAWLTSLEQNESSEIEFVNFRSKSTGWEVYSLLYKFNCGKVCSHKFSADWYMKAFLTNASLRSSCFDCPAKRSCGSDITLGDFWGIKSAHPEVDYSNGVSAVIINTQKGQEAFDAIVDKLEYGSSSFAKVLLGNPCLVKSVLPYAKHDAFMADITASLPIEEMMRKWEFRPSLYQRARSCVSKVKQRLLG